MRKFIIDTDTAADDAVALLIACNADIEILGVTTVCGNIPLELATKNALQVLETANAKIPVYKGLDRPLYRPLFTAEYVHGKDGMGDKNLVHPKTSPENKDAIDFILETVEKNPCQIELITIGPVTNIAAAILKAPDTMKKVKHIYSMGTAGLEAGNVTEFAEFNVYVDAESYDIMLKSGISVTIIGLDMCLGDSSFTENELENISKLGKLGEFVSLCTSKILEHNIKAFESHTADIPDAVALSCVVWEDTLKAKDTYFAAVHTENDEKYGMVTFEKGKANNCTLVTEFDAEKFKEYLTKTLS
ncbi:MAG: nucleoside hydrolase [Oscillospiraceae bacterium]|nr:nucleoside hydrolase [Oscillospiraceae bacterium]